MTARTFFFPTEAADVRRQGQFNVYEGTNAVFQLQVSPEASKQDRLEVLEARAVRATVAIDRIAPSPWLVDNTRLQARSWGLSYRSDKSLNSKVRDEVAVWGSTVFGVDLGDNWLLVGKHYLPKTVSGVPVLAPQSQIAPDERTISMDDGARNVTLLGRGNSYVVSQWSNQTGLFGSWLSRLVQHEAAEGPFNVTIGAGSRLIEVTKETGHEAHESGSDGKLLASVAMEQVEGPDGKMMLQLTMDHVMDSALCLTVCVAALRMLPEHQESLPFGRGVFEFEIQQFRLPMRCFYYLPDPDKFNPDVAPLIVLHGHHRDAERCFDLHLLSGEVQRLNVFLLVPEFSEDAFPGYDCGNVFAQDVDLDLDAFAQDRDEHRTDDGSPNPLLPLNPIEKWAFYALERTFDVACKRAGATAKSYTLYGHSEGSEFIHRFVLLYGAAAAAGVVPNMRLGNAICANAGWYTMPTAEYKFPYGIRDLPAHLRWNTGGNQNSKEESLTNIFVQAPITVLLGEADTDSDKPGRYTRRSREADAQGSTRFGRGQRFFELGEIAAGGLGVPFGWQLKTVPTIGHDDALMCIIALSLQYDPTVYGQVDVSVLGRIERYDVG